MIFQTWVNCWLHLACLMCSFFFVDNLANLQLHFLQFYFCKLVYLFWKVITFFQQWWYTASANSHFVLLRRTTHNMKCCFQILASESTHFVMPKMYSVVISYYVIISIYWKDNSTVSCRKTQRNMYHWNGAILVANRRPVSISSRWGYLLNVEIDLSD